MKSTLLSFLASTLILSLFSACSSRPLVSDTSYRDPASDFPLAVLPKPPSAFVLTTNANQSSYYDYMSSTIVPEMKRLAPSANKEPNQKALVDGMGVSIQLDEHNYNFHVNFPNAAQGGRSYGWTSGQVGDWSDQMYLDHLADVSTQTTDADLGALYQTIVQMLGACDPSGIHTLNTSTQRIATNFLAIYTAEEYRAFVGTPNWDDALLQVTLLSAFHGGQKTLTKFYDGKFSAQSFKQAPGVYRGTVAGTAKPSALDDYWQFTANPSQTRSGINLTRSDFVKMGTAITKYESTVGQNPDLTTIQGIVGNSTNAFSGISQYFAKDKSKTISVIPSLATATAKFLIQVKADAEKITTWELNGEN